MEADWPVIVTLSGVEFAAAKLPPAATLAVIEHVPTLFMVTAPLEATVQIEDELVVEKLSAFVSAEGATVAVAVYAEPKTTDDADVIVTVGVSALIVTVCVLVVAAKLPLAATLA
jgi:hypothetical protein